MMKEKRNQMKGGICATHTRTMERKEMEEEYGALSKEVDKSTSKDNPAYVDSIAKEAQVALSDV